MAQGRVDRFRGGSEICTKIKGNNWGVFFQRESNQLIVVHSGENRSGGKDGEKRGSGHFAAKMKFSILTKLLAAEVEKEKFHLEMKRQQDQ